MIFTSFQGARRAPATLVLRRTTSFDCFWLGAAWPWSKWKNEKKRKKQKVTREMKKITVTTDQPWAGREPDQYVTRGTQGQMPIPSQVWFHEGRLQPRGGPILRGTGDNRPRPSPNHCGVNRNNVPKDPESFCRGTVKQEFYLQLELNEFSSDWAVQS